MLGSYFAHDVTARIPMLTDRHDLTNHRSAGGQDLFQLTEGYMGTESICSVQLFAVCWRVEVIEYVFVPAGSIAHTACSFFS